MWYCFTREIRLYFVNNDRKRLRQLKENRLDSMSQYLIGAWQVGLKNVHPPDPPPLKNIDARVWWCLNAPFFEYSLAYWLPSYGFVHNLLSLDQHIAFWAIPSVPRPTCFSRQVTRKDGRSSEREFRSARCPEADQVSQYGHWGCKLTGSPIAATSCEPLPGMKSWRRGERCFNRRKWASLLVGVWPGRLS
jgi:hypothetical protein